MKLPLAAALLPFTLFAQPKVAGLRLEPADVTLWGDSASQRFLVLARDANGFEEDVTAQARFSLANAGGTGARGEIDATGKFRAVADGRQALTASYGGQTARSNIRIEGASEHRAFSFATSIGGIFTRRGCNSSECHGGVKGKAGFKLSSNALFPEDDYRWTVEGGTFDVLSAESKGAKVPRIDRKDPANSLILRKATLQIAHGGGRRLDPNSSDYQIILNWVRAGAPFGETAAEKGVSIQSIEVFPKQVMLRPGGRHRLLVTAVLSNGRRDDISDQVLLVSNDADVVTAGEGGVLQAKKLGETSVLIRAAGHAVSAGVGVIGSPIPNYPKIETRNYIDEHVFAKLRKFNIVPSRLSGDEEFLRRVCLDLTGTLPPPDRVREFIANPRPSKRDELIESLLGSPEFVDYWGFRFGDLLRTTFVTSNNAAAVKAYDDWILNSLAANKPFDRIAMERIAAQGYSAPARNFYYVAERTAPEVLMPELIRVFLGRRMDCAQCHNHPFESWSQNQFWGLTAFFGGVTDLRQSNLIIDTLGENHADKSRDMSVTHPRTKEKVVPAFLDGRKLPRVEWQDPRLSLAKWVVAHPYFAEAAANRMWGYFFGRGLVDPVDDFRTTNPPTHPELLAALGEDFRLHGYDLRRLMRTIVQSRTYQLSTVPNDTNRDDRINYSRAQPRALEAAVLLDAISSVTGVAEDFRFHRMAGGGDPAPGAKAVSMIPDICPSQFMDAFGRSMRKTPPGGLAQPNLTQALHMLAGSTYTAKISRPEGRLARLLTNHAADGDILDEFYLAALTRLPAPDEKRALLEALEHRRSDRQAAFDGLVWAVIGSREFAHNH